MTFFLSQRVSFFVQILKLSKVAALFSCVQSRIVPKLYRLSCDDVEYRLLCILRILSKTTKNKKQKKNKMKKIVLFTLKVWYSLYKNTRKKQNQKYTISSLKFTFFFILVCYFQLYNLFTASIQRHDICQIIFGCQLVRQKSTPNKMTYS